MPDTSIPVTYAGGQSYALVFRQVDDGLMVRKDYDETWKPVADVRMTPDERNPARLIVEINGDLKHGVPIFVWMDEAGWETLRGLRG